MIIVIGGGAAGIFAAICAKEAHPELPVAVLEKSAVLLAKVRISGGGRCNVTHSCFEPQLLIKNYPRGHKELLGPFHHFGPQDTIDWFSSRNAPLKTEKDGRMFPITNSSQTIIDSLLKEAQTLGVTIHKKCRIEKIVKTKAGFIVDNFSCTKLILATGSSPVGYAWAEQLGHTIQKPVPSLFTFNVPTSPLNKFSGIAIQDAKLQVGPFVQTGPLLITHFGFSGPAVLKLSSWAARYLYEQNYCTPLHIKWPEILPKRLKNPPELFAIEGKNTNKEEFVTCGGVTLKEVNFKTMESKICPGLHFAGEILDIDGVTGGFNFQSAWTTGFLAGNNA